MGEYYSTQATLEARASALRLKGWIDYDNDGVINAETLERAQKFSRGEIRDMLESIVGSDTIDTWTDATVPESVGSISDDLCIWYCTTTNPALAKQVQVLYTEAMKRLKAMADGSRTIYGVITAASDSYVTERSPSDADPERELDDMSVRTTWDAPDVRELPGY